MPMSRGAIRPSAVVAGLAVFVRLGGQRAKRIDRLGHWPTALANRHTLQLRRAAAGCAEGAVQGVLHATPEASGPLPMGSGICSPWSHAT